MPILMKKVWDAGTKHTCMHDRTRRQAEREEVTHKKERGLNE